MAGENSFNFWNYGKENKNDLPDSSFLNSFGNNIINNAITGNSISQNTGIENLEEYNQPEFDINTPQMEKFGTMPQGAPIKFFEVNNSSSDTVKFGNNNTNNNSDEYTVDMYWRAFL